MRDAFLRVELKQSRVGGRRVADARRFGGAAGSAGCAGGEACATGPGPLQNL